MMNLTAWDCKISLWKGNNPIAPNLFKLGIRNDFQSVITLAFGFKLCKKKNR